uniref:Leucine-rich repeat-containing N-terminal plant-type domain-containing protein n=1 Tax=Cryptomonas curvata TaxID=233186 RepID=A0A7S0M5X8_9CRYP|mmetsp:Transcript_26100/g.54272  ORF Transcript_26100/g.54272 Transcript_26100/m.54272 type:complete len:346 (+) Transcript_26100:48-1085(+)
MLATVHIRGRRILCTPVICLFLFYLFILSSLARAEEVSSITLRDDDLASMKMISADWHYPTVWVGEDPCRWQGVICEIFTEGIFFTTTTKAVVSISLRGVCSAISEEDEENCVIGNNLGNLRNLRHVYLNGNGFHGEIPSSLSALKNLQSLYLNANKLSGTIPASLGNLQMLEKLYLNSNHLSGTIPGKLGDAQNLHQLELQQNNLGGTIPVELSKLRLLVQLDLNDNQLEGPIPAALGNLTALHRLHLGRNRLTGAIPPPLLGPGLPSLTVVDLSDNRLTGPVPFGICKMKNLAVFNADGNDLTGDAPRCQPVHGPHSDAENRRACREHLRGFCVTLPQVRTEL